MEKAVSNLKVHFASAQDVLSFSVTLRRHVVPWKKELTFDKEDPDRAANIRCPVQDGRASDLGLRCENWRKHWEEDYRSEDQVRGSYALMVHFPSLADREEFMRRVGLPARWKQSFWWPLRERKRMSQRNAEPIKVRQGRHPVYIISKGRWAENLRLTHKTLKSLGVEHKVVVEPQEQADYAREVGAEHLLVLPFSNLGKGSIPARNWVWEHAIAAGSEKHWIVDDNIDGFYACNNNLKWRVRDENPLALMEEFADKHGNVALLGPHYEFFCPRTSYWPPLIINTRVYSCILIRNDLPFRWRGRYNEDTDLSLRCLKAGWATVLFYRWLIKKMPTMKLKGGNTDELYAKDGRKKMAQSLQRQHPDCVRITTRWNRAQHIVDYRKFKRNPLTRKERYGQDA